MVYGVFNGAGYFQNFVKTLENAYNEGTTTADGLLRVFLDERIAGGFKSSTLIANTGLIIEKLVGLS